jgi:hypothetical protein
MVWGMTLPGNFGDFWPNGEFEKGHNSRDGVWYQRLRDYYKEQTLEEQKRLYDYAGEGANHYYGTFASYKLTSEPLTRAGGPDRPLCSPIQPHEPPRTFDTEKTYMALGAIIQLNDMILAVDENLKGIIERLEPAVHGFYPIEIRMPKGKVYPTQYYTILIGQYFDAFSSGDTMSAAVEEYAPGKFHIVGHEWLAFRKEVVGQAHLWRDRSFTPELTCFSDELQAEIAKAGLRMPKQFAKMKEV